MELELKHLAPYLPYGLHCKLSNEGIFNLDSEYTNEHQLKIGVIKHFSFYEDEISGSFWVTDKYSFDFDSQSEIEIILRPLSDLTKEIEHNGEKLSPEKILSHLDLEWLITSDNLIMKTNYEDVLKLLEWHFDIFGLIDAGLAIDINQTNPGQGH